MLGNPLDAPPFLLQFQNLNPNGDFVLIVRKPTNVVSLLSNVTAFLQFLFSLTVRVDQESAESIRWSAPRPKSVLCQLALRLADCPGFANESDCNDESPRCSWDGSADQCQWSEPTDLHIDASATDCIDDGVSSEAPADDIDGESRDSSPDVGADEISP